MAALTDLSDLVNRLSGGSSGAPETQNHFKLARISGAAAATPIAGRLHSAWQYDGFPAGGSAPGAAAIPTASTQGAAPYTNAASGKEKFMQSIAVLPAVGGNYTLYDRLFHMSGLSGTSTSSQTVQGSPASPAITRNTGGVGNVVFLEIYTLIGTTAATCTVTYIDQDGNSATATTQLGGTNFREATRLVRVPLAAGDTGVRSVTSVQLSVSTGTVGDFGVTIARPIATISGATGIGAVRDFVVGQPGMPIMVDNMCLAWAYSPVSATATEFTSAFTAVEK
jgi:hypothetical protein